MADDIGARKQRGRDHVAGQDFPRDFKLPFFCLFFFFVFFLIFSLVSPTRYDH